MVLKIVMINKVDVSMEDQSTEKKRKRKRKNYRESATIMGTDS